MEAETAFSGPPFHLLTALYSHQHIRGDSGAARELSTEGEVRVWLYPHFEDNTWKFFEADDKGAGGVIVSLWGWKDRHHLRAEIVSWAVHTPCTYEPPACVPESPFPSTGFIVGTCCSPR